MAARRLPSTASLSQRLPKGAEGGKEFARIVDLLLIHEARRRGQTLTHLDDTAGDYAGLDSFAENYLLDASDKTGYQYKFFPSPLSNEHRAAIKKALEDALAKTPRSRIKTWVIVTPDDLTESAVRADGGDVSWFEALREKFGKTIVVEHWGHKRLVDLFLENPSLCLLYYPEILPEGKSRLKTIEAARKAYNENLERSSGKIQFVGMSIRTDEAARAVKLESLYIPLHLVPEGGADQGPQVLRTDPLTLLAPGERHVILGDPGSGKSTLLKFLALAGQTSNLQKRFGAKHDPDRLPVLVTLRRYADGLKANPDLPLVDHIIGVTQGDYNLKSADLAYFEFYLETGRAILCFDGLDELPNPQFKRDVRDRINSLLTTYPGNTCLVTSRIVGYDHEFRFGDDFRHSKIAALRLPEIEQFVTDWYTLRESDATVRKANIKHLVSVIKDIEQEAIRTLAANPLLLTIMTLVHKIDSVLPDVRVVLYQKCTETLLNTWHTWKQRDTSDETSRDRIERRNRVRIEALACWMHEQSAETGSRERAVASHVQVRDMLTKHIKAKEFLAPDKDPEEEAERFLEFVRKRAGLLIEIGDGQYSFVHLTFQEYLTSTHLKRSAERGGARDLWKSIAPHVGDARWEETLRLLVAGLDSGETRKYLVDELLKRAGKAPTVGLASLILGCLLDRIEEAERALPDILRVALAAVSGADNRGDIRHLANRMANLRTRRAAVDSGTLIKAAADLAKTLSSDRRRALALSLALVGFDAAEVPPSLLSAPSKQDASDCWFRVLFSSRLKRREVDLAPLRSSLDALQRDLGIADISHDGPYLSSSAIAIAFLLGPEVGERYLVRHLIDIRKLHSYFVFRWVTTVFYRYVDVPGLDEPTWSFLSNWGRFSRAGRARNNFLNIAIGQAIALMGFTDQAYRKALAHPVYRKSLMRWYATKTSAPSGPYELLKCAQDMARGFEAVPQAAHKPSAVWDVILKNTRMAESLAEQLQKSLGLEPPAHWLEALLRSFARVANTGLERARVQELLDGASLDGKEDLAGCLLILDSELWLLEHYETPDESHFKALAERARGSRSAVLRLVTCLRDLSYGDESRTDDLVQMVRSPDPELKVLLDECLWFPPDPNDLTQVAFEKELRRASLLLNEGLEVEEFMKPGPSPKPKKARSRTNARPK